MLLTLATTHRPATDLGWLLHKHPDRVQTFELPFGNARVFYPEASEGRCRAALLVEVDPVALVRGRGDGTLTQYVNDRPYVASSFMSVALSRVFGTALAGRSRERPDLVERELPLEAELPVVTSRGGEPLLRRLFEPLGWAVTIERHPLDPTDGTGAPSPYLRLRLEGTGRVRELLAHLYVLLPVLDDDKHYFVGRDEVDKLLAHGEGWLGTHPERELVTQRYLRHRRSLVRDALARLVADETADPDAEEARHDGEEARLERPLRLNDVRIEAVAETIRASGARRVLDLGCGEGRLLKALLAQRGIEEVVGVDASLRALEIASRRLHLDELSPRARARIRLVHGALTYRDRGLAGFDAAAIVEVIEHLDPERLGAFERVVFGEAAPGLVVLTTPNAEYNARFPDLPAGHVRHPDHRFEWTRAEFASWAEGVAERHGYALEVRPVGDVDPELGAATQMGVFRR